MKFRTALVSDQGPRDDNQDDGLALQVTHLGGELAVVGVCDGMGGDANGKRAALEVAHSLATLPFMLPPDVARNPGAHRELLGQSVLMWQRAALERLEEIAGSEGLQGLTTTVAACFMWEQGMMTWWLGDSRVYRFRDGRLERLTTDHSKVEGELHLPEEEALEHPSRSIVSRFMRPGVPWKPEIRFDDLHEEDVILAVSDGVCGSCRSWELEAFLAYWLATDITPEELGRRILAFVKGNSRDNATVALAMRATPKPFSSQVATIEFPTFIRHGLDQEVLGTLTAYPKRAQEWESRTVPGWRRLEVGPGASGLGGDVPRVAASCSPGTSHGWASVCLECGRQVEPDRSCEGHSKRGLWQGPYVEVVSPAGEISIHPVAEHPLVLGRAVPGDSDEGYVVLESDEWVSGAHLEMVAGDDGVLVRDHKSDNGVWRRVEGTSRLERSELERGVTLRAGHHLLIVHQPGHPPGGSEHDVLDVDRGGEMLPVSSTFPVLSTGGGAEPTRAAQTVRVAGTWKARRLAGLSAILKHLVPWRWC